jgi:hypothetical protein
MPLLRREEPEHMGVSQELWRGELAGAAPENVPPAKFLRLVYSLSVRRPDRLGGLVARRVIIVSDFVPDSRTPPILLVDAPGVLDRSGRRPPPGFAQVRRHHRASGLRTPGLGYCFRQSCRA